MKVPCSWKDNKENFKKRSLSSNQVKPIWGKGNVPNSVSIRRDGLMTFQDDNSLIEWMIPTDVIRILENRSLFEFDITNSYLENFKYIDIDLYGHHLTNSNSIFSAPQTLQWDFTSRCNLQCKHCYADATSESKNELTKLQIFEIIDEAAQLGVKALHILGGEPFARKDLVEIIRYASNLGVGSHISSNGTLIKREHAEYLSGLKDVTIDISIDSVQGEHHDWLRGVEGAYEKAIEGVRLLQEHYIPVGTTCTIYPSTLSEMELIAKQAHDLDLYRLQYLFVSPVGRAERFSDKLIINDHQKQLFAEQFDNLVEKYENRMIVDSPVVPFEPENGSNINFYKNDYWLIGCLAGVEKMAIRSDGTVTACPQLDQVYGNLKTSSLGEIWSYMHSDRLVKLGHGCDIYNFNGYCGGGCPAPDSHKDEIAPCIGRRQAISAIDFVKKIEISAYCPTDKFLPCQCPIYKPCDCPTWCNLPCNYPCDCPTWCASPCSCPTWCPSPCPFPCPSPCLSPCTLPCSCPTHCPLPR